MQVGTNGHAGSELHAWRGFLARTTLWLGVLLLGSAVVCGVAANWQGLSTTQRFALAQGLLIVSTLAALWLRLRLRAVPDTRRRVAGAVLTLSGLFLGALLALVGQTYQTGADTWELFALWAALLIPWCLAAASQVLWLLWVLVLNLAVALWLGEQVFSWWTTFDGAGFPSLVMALLNLVLLAGWELAARRHHLSTKVGPRVLVLLAVGVLVSGLILGDLFLGLRSRHTMYILLAWLAITGGLGYYYQRVRLDLVILAVLAAGVIGVSLRMVGEWLVRLEPGVWALLPLAGLLMAEAVWAARWLRRLAQRAPAPLAGGVVRDPAVAADAALATAADAEPAGESAGLAVEPAAADAPVIALSDSPDDAHAGSPWYIQGLLGLSAWISTLLLLAFLALSGIVMSAEGALVVGLVLCAGGVAVLRTDAGPFWRQCAIASAFAGQIMIMYGLSESTSFSGACLALLVLGAVIYVAAPDHLLRFLSTWIMAFGGTGLLWEALRPNVMGDGMIELFFAFDMLRATFIWLPVTVIGAWWAAVAFCADRHFKRRSHVLDPMGWALVIAVQAVVWQAGGVALRQFPSLWSLHPQTAILSLAGALLPVIAALWVLWPRRRVLTRALVFGVPLGLLVLALFWLPSPGIAFALTWLLLGFGLNKPRLTVFGVLAMLSYLMFYYYQLDVPLLDKAIWLAGAAGLLLVMRLLVWLLPRWMRTAPAPLAPRGPIPGGLRWRSAVILGGLVLVLGLTNYGIWQREQLLAQGRVAILALAPVDPRSIMQGDYMALRFAAGDDVYRLRGDLPASETQAPGGLLRTDGYVVLKADDRGVAQVLRVQDGKAPSAQDEIVLRYRVRPMGVRIVTDAYFFPEGEAPRYEAARFGEVRYDGSGTALLVRMLDKDLKPL